MSDYYKSLGIRVNGIYTMREAAKILGVNRGTIRRWGKEQDSIYSYTPSIRKVSDKRSEYTITGKQILEVYKKKHGLPELDTTKNKKRDTRQNS